MSLSTIFAERRGRRSLRFFRSDEGVAPYGLGDEKTLSATDSVWFSATHLSVLTAGISTLPL